MHTIIQSRQCTLNLMSKQPKYIILYTCTWFCTVRNLVTLIQRSEHTEQSMIRLGEIRGAHNVENNGKLTP